MAYQQGLRARGKLHLTRTASLFGARERPWLQKGMLSGLGAVCSAGDPRGSLCATGKANCRNPGRHPFSGPGALPGPEKRWRPGFLQFAPSRPPPQTVGSGEPGRSRAESPTSARREPTLSPRRRWTFRPGPPELARAAGSRTRKMRTWTEIHVNFCRVGIFRPPQTVGSGELGGSGAESPTSARRGRRLSRRRRWTFRPGPRQLARAAAARSRPDFSEPAGARRPKLSLTRMSPALSSGALPELKAGDIRVSCSLARQKFT